MNIILIIHACIDQTQFVKANSLQLDTFHVTNPHLLPTMEISPMDRYGRLNINNIFLMARHISIELMTLLRLTVTLKRILMSR